MPDSAVVTTMRNFKRDLAKKESAQVAEMGYRWRRVNVSLRRNINALAEDMVKTKLAGGTVSRSKLFINERYQELMGQLQDELVTYTNYAEKTIIAAQERLVREGIRHAETAMKVSGVQAGFNRLPVSAVENLVGITAEGGPLRDLLMASWPLSFDMVTNELVSGVALGYNPRKVARKMAEAAGASSRRMMVIARTEQLRVYREASRQSYQRSGWVTGYRRLATHDKRVCAACLADDGAFYTLNQEMPEHPQGRCAMVPVVFKAPEPEWKAGEEWFKEQDVSTQKAILGRDRYELYQKGKLDFKDLATVKPNATWGPSLKVTPIKDLGKPKPAPPKPAPKPRKPRTPKPAPPAPAPAPAPAPTPPTKTTRKPRAPKPANVPTINLTAPQGPPVGIPAPSAGAPVSDSLQVGRGTADKAIGKAIKAIDKVHGDGNLRQIPLQQEDVQGINGAYYSIRNQNRAGIPKKITIGPSGDTVELTTAHEIGHFIDDQILNVALGRDSHKLLSPEIEAWYDAINNSNAVKVMQENIRSGKMIFAGREYAADIKYLTYATTPEELWARSYAQYIAFESGDENMKHQVRKVVGGYYGERQWADDDFVPIREAITGILKAVGWK